MRKSIEFRKPVASAAIRAGCSMLEETVTKIKRHRAKISKRKSPNVKGAPFAPLSTGIPLDTRMDILRDCFDAADRTHTAAIDRSVQECVRIAHFLWSHRRILRKYVSDETARQLLRKGMKHEEFLRVTFLRSHPNSKTASLYYRATRSFFQAGLAVEAIPSKVRKAGGYQALANANVRFPRKENPGERQVRQGGGKVLDGDRQVAAALRADQKLDPTGSKELGRAPLRRSLPGSHSVDAGEHEESGSTVAIVATLKAAGCEFRDLPWPCHATVDMHITSVSGGEWLVEIRNATLLDEG